MSISNVKRWYGSRLAALVTTFLFVTLSLLASGPHPFDDDMTRPADSGLTLCSSSGHAGIPCPLCDWVANAVASPALVLAPVPVPCVETLRHCAVTLDAPLSAPVQPVGRAPPVCFI